MALITGAAAGPVASSAIAVALAAEGAELMQACGPAAPLLLSLYFHHEKRIFALLTDDSNFFVLGVRLPFTFFFPFCRCTVRLCPSIFQSLC